MSTENEQLAEKLKEAGTRLLSPPPSVDNLLPLLDDVERRLELVEQSPSQIMLDALSPSMKALVAPELLGHSDSDVNVSVATCISEITRITAPDAPYSDDQMKEIFQLIVSSFEKLLDTSSRSYNKRITMLETVAKVRSCVMMLDLECDDLILQMFQHFLKSVRDFHPDKVYSSMETIMTLVLEESEDISPELLSSILEYLKKDDKNVEPIARKLGENVLSKCSSKVKPYLVQAIQTLGFSLDDYSNVVASVCQELSGAGDVNGVNVESISQVKEALKDTVSQTSAPDTPKSTITNGNLQKVVEEPEVDKECLTEKKCDDHTENKPSEESDMIKDEVELIVKPQAEEKSNKKRGRKGNSSKTTLEPSEATPAEEGNDAENVTDLQKSEDEDGVSLQSKDTPADKKRGRMGNSKNTLEPSEATPVEEGNDAEKVTDLQNSESKGSVSLHSKETPADKKRGRKGIFLKTTLEPSETTATEEDDDAEGGTDLQERESKDSGSLHSKDTPDKRRGRKGNLSKDTLEPSEATRAEEYIDAEDLTDLHENESKGSASLHSKDTPTDKRRGKNGNLSKTTLEPSEATPAEDNDADRVTDIEGSQSKDSGALPSKDIPVADNTPSPNRDKGVDISHPLSKASENKVVDIPSPSPSGHTTEESPLKKADREHNAEVVLEEVIALPEDDSKMESEADDSELKADKVTGQETSSATDKEENTVGPVDAARTDDGSTIDSDTKTTKLSSGKVESVRDKQDAKKKKKAQGKTPLVKDRVKPPPKKECKESGSSTKVATKSAKKGSYSASSKKESDQKNSKRMRATGKEKASEIAKCDEDLVGCRIKVYWPKDKMYYAGVVESFNPNTKKHKIVYTDGDVEMLNMKAEDWKFDKDGEESHKEGGSDGENPEASSEIHKRKKIKTNPDPSNKQGKSLSANKKKVGGTPPRRSKAAVQKLASKLSDEMDVDTSDDEDAKESGGSEGEKDGKSSNTDSGDESMDETPKRAGKSKVEDVETPKASTKSKQQTTKVYSRSKGKTATGTGSKTNPNRTGKAKPGSSSSKGKETAIGKQSKQESAKSSQGGKGKSSNTATKAQKVETKSGNKRKRGSSKK